MNMLRIIGCGMAVLVISYATANAQTANQMYFQVLGSLVNVEDSDISAGAVSGTLETDNGFGLSGALGYHITKDIRGELEIAYREADPDRLTVSAFGLTAAGAVGGEFSEIAVMANLYYDIQTSSKFTPYVGVGIGGSRLDIELTAGGATSESDDTVFAYQAMAGVKYAVADNGSLVFGYRYHATQDPDFGGTDAEYASHNFEAGFVINF